MNAIKHRSFDELKEEMEKFQEFLARHVKLSRKLKENGYYAMPALFILRRPGRLSGEDLRGAGENFFGVTTGDMIYNISRLAVGEHAIPCTFYAVLAGIKKDVLYRFLKQKYFPEKREPEETAQDASETTETAGIASFLEEYSENMSSSPRRGSEEAEPEVENTAGFLKFIAFGGIARISKTHFELKHFRVNREFQRCGIGTMLAYVLLYKLAYRGDSTLNIPVNENSVSALEDYGVFPGALNRVVKRYDTKQLSSFFGIHLSGVSNDARSVFFDPELNVPAGNNLKMSDLHGSVKDLLSIAGITVYAQAYPEQEGAGEFLESLFGRPAAKKLGLDLQKNMYVYASNALEVMKRAGQNLFRMGTEQTGTPFFGFPFVMGYEVSAISREAFERFCLATGILIENEVSRIAPLRGVKRVSSRAIADVLDSVRELDEPLNWQSFRRALTGDDERTRSRNAEEELEEEMDNNFLLNM